MTGSEDFMEATATKQIKGKTEKSTLPASKKPVKRTKDVIGPRAMSKDDSIYFTLDSNAEQTALTRESMRAIYNNRDTSRLLGSFIAAPVVDLLAGFIGIPELQPTGEDMSDGMEILTAVIEQNKTAISQAQRFALRDGKSFLLFSYEVPTGALYTDTEPGRITARVILAEQMLVLRDPITGDVNYATLKENITWVNEKGKAETATLRTTWTPKEVARKIEQAKTSIPEGLPLGVSENKWGFVPVVEFVNEPETYGSEGVSELERIEPLIKLYHEVLAAAAKGSKIHSTPKLSLILEDKANFLKANFPEVLEAIKSGGSRPKVNLTGRELLVLGENDKAAYIEANNPIGSAVDLLRIIFYCMIITSQTPEFVLGVHMSSSYASTTEQTPVWQMKVQRKQAQFTSPWHLIGRIILAMKLKSSGRKASSYGVKVVWPMPDTRDKAAVARQQYDTVQAVLAAVDGMLMSDKAAVETLRSVFPAMATYEASEGNVSEMEEIKRTVLERQALVNEQAPTAGQKFDLEAALATLDKQAGL